MLEEIVSDLVKINDILIVVRTDGAIIEMRSNSLSFRKKDKWITVGENDGPCHMHINASTIAEARFLEEKRSDRTSYSIRFFDDKGERQFSAVFAKMYDQQMNLKPKRKKLYDDLFEKYGSQHTIKFKD